ncbi:MAG: hypothetical protein M1820_005521 [Bogoriella megaspora]|nr:MAG: hypothetical protein M1820_005521 [Bogoriella megaspora]
MVYQSLLPNIELPRNITVWDWLFDSPSSPINSPSNSRLAGYTDAITKERVNYEDVKNYSTYIHTALAQHYGLKTGDTVALFSPNTIWYPVAMFAAIRAGAMVSGASPAYNAEEMTYALKTARANFLMTSPPSIELAKAAAAAAGIPQKHNFLLEGSIDGYTTIKDLISLGQSSSQQAPAFKIPPDKTNFDICGFLSFSSGTTGLPKAVMIAHQNVIASCLQIQAITLPSHKKVLAVLPLFHITGLVHGLNLPILLNAEVYMLPSFTMKSMLDTICEYQIKELLLAPPILIRLVRDPLVKEYDLSYVKRFSSGAAPLSKEIIRELKTRFPHTGFKQGYGMTESCCCITLHTPEHYSYEYAHAVGTICASTTVKIVDEKGRECVPGQAGEIWAKGPQIVMGYLGDEKATRETFDEEGYLHTGDQGVVDEMGMVTITDRIKELIKVKGIGGAPAELEDVLLGHPKVEDCAVLGVKDKYSGERPKAYVVLRGGQKGDEDVGKELLDYVRQRKVKHKWIAEIEFVKEIPKSASGKILRRVLRDAKVAEKGVVVRNAVKDKAKL